MDWSGLNNACMNAFAETVDAVFTVDGNDHTVSAIFSGPWTGPAAASRDIQRQDTTVSVKTEDVPAGLKRGILVLVKSKNYEFVSAEPDDGGMTEIVISRV